MKKSVIAANAMFACTVMLTFMIGLAQAQSPTMVEEDQVLAEESTDQQPMFVGSDRFYTADCRVGPRNGDVNLTCIGIGFPSPNPRTVLCQLRNSPAQPVSFPDQFACQVIRTSPGSVTVRIRRIDDGTGPSGWGQNLRLNLLIVN